MGLSTKTLNNENVFTPKYAAPEVLANLEIGTQSDVYSFAILL